jgi:ribosomal protein S18 acetylase RimI-like enzyme
MRIELRRVVADDWRTVRALRLRALAEAPDAFAATLDEELALEESRWQAWAASNGQAQSTIGFFALCDGTEAGLAVGVRSEADPNTVVLNALWVAPEARHCGAASILVEAVRTWARELAADKMELTVTKTSHAAIALYERLGFEVVAKLATTCGRRAAPALRMQRSVRAPA